jgi:methionyl aminopeptidase
VIYLKSPTEINQMRQAGACVARILDEMVQMVVPGMATMELDTFAESRCKQLKVIPAFKGYRGFPGSVCISVNEEVVHGIPSKTCILKEGDIVGLDFGVVHQGWYGDSARTVAVGRVSEAASHLMCVTEESLALGIAECKAGNRLHDIGHAVQNYVEKNGYSVVREFVGHGIGKALHEEPSVPNYGFKGQGLLLKVGMVLAIEPMVNAGGHELRILSDGWTAVTVDRALSAHFEHTVAITSSGPEILTLPESA